MTDIVFMTVVGQNVFADPWNQTDDIFEEHEPGLLSTIFDHRCGGRVGEGGSWSYSCFNWSSEMENE